MADKMLIDASHPEETRVVVVRRNRIEEFDFESQHKKQLRGNIYLAKVTRVEPSLQAAFVDYGGNRHGFLAFSEIHPDYYQIHQSDRQALLEAEAAEAEAARLKDAQSAQKSENLDEGDVSLGGQDSADPVVSDAEPAKDKPKPKRRRSRRKKSTPGVEAAVEAGVDAGVDAAGQTADPAALEPAALQKGEDIEKASDESADVVQEADSVGQDNIAISKETAAEPVAQSPVTDEKDDGATVLDQEQDSAHAPGDKRSGKSGDDDTPSTMAAMIETDDEISEPVGDDSNESNDAAAEGDLDADDAAQKNIEGKAASGDAAVEAPTAEDPTAEEPKEEKPKRRRTRRKSTKSTATSKALKNTDDDIIDVPLAQSDTDDGADASSATDAKSEKDETFAGEANQDASSSDISDFDGLSDDADDENIDENVEEVGVEDALEELPETPKKLRKQYRIQEVIKRRQIILVQIVKEERGNKGAALTTYLSLAGRYSVLMPNTARGGGISRKITDVQDRKRLKEIAQELEVPNGMGVILRTAGASRTKTEIRRDFEYLMRLWESVRDLTLNSIAPCLVYEEGSLIKRSVRDLYNKDIGEVVVAGEDGYREAKDFMKMLMPSHAKAVQRYRGTRPIFVNSGIEAQLDQMMSPQVTLKSGGYLIINQTEALVAVDVNSGRSTRESSVEDTALATNLEAAEEVARQLRLRDLAGLVVIDFIDMEEKRNNRAVEKRLKECLKNDRARIQVGRISHFGLLEMSRQRIRASVLESTTQPCAHCQGTGLVRSDSSFALQILRGIEEQLLKSPRNDVNAQTSVHDALYILNHKRDSLNELEERFGVTISIQADPSLVGQEYVIERGAISQKTAKIDPSRLASSYGEADAEMLEDDAVTDSDHSQEDEDAPRKKRRRRRRRGRGASEEASTQQDGADLDNEPEQSDDSDDHQASQEVQSADGDDDDKPKRRRRRGKRGGRKNRERENDGPSLEHTEPTIDAVDEAADASQISADEGSADVVSDDVTAEPASDALKTQSDAQPADTTADESADTNPDIKAGDANKQESADKPKKPRKRRTKKVEAISNPVADTAPDDLYLGKTDVPSSQDQEPSSSVMSADTRTDGTDGDVVVKDTQPKAKPSRRSRTDLEKIASEPVVTSSSGAPSTEQTSKKTGWWRRAFKAD